MQKGLTLIERMIGVAIIGILATITILAWQQHQEKNPKVKFRNTATQPSGNPYAQPAMQGCKRSGENTSRFVLKCPDGSLHVFLK